MKTTRSLLFICMLMIPATGLLAQKHNQLTRQEKKEGWVLMFNGKDLEGWRTFAGTVPPGVWSASEGTLHCRSLKRDDAKPGEKGLIMYDGKFKDFHFKAEWKIAEAGNSGIFYLGQEEGFGSIIQTAPEMQVLDNEKHPDSFKGKKGNRKAGSLYDLIPADPQNAHPAGEWNSVEIIVKDRHVTHIMNGEKVLDYQLDTDEWKELVAGSKFPGIRADWYQVPMEGYIGLQDHNDNVWYRNLKIKAL